MIRIPRVLCGLLAGVFLFGACVDPTANMTPEEKVAYHAEQEAKRQARAKAKAEFEARVIQDVTTQGEAHSEMRDASIVGAYSYAWDRKEKKVPMFHKQEREGTRWRAEHLTLFANGSYARRVDKSIWKYDKGSEGSDEPDKVTRGQWKTDGKRLLMRPITPGGYGDWRDVGGYELKGNHLLVVDDQACKAELDRRQLKEDQGLEALMILGMHTYPWKK